MPSTSVTQAMPRSAAEVFALLHNYPRRLEWDTLLREARLTRGHTEAKKGATSLCVGKPFLGLIGVETKYLTYDPGKMINSPLFFQSFAASIRHQDTPTGSTATYKLTFTAKPRLLRWLLHPLMLRALKIETRKRLTALATFLQADSP
jgi:hypothetical protein